MTSIRKLFKWTFLIGFAIIVLGSVSLWLFFPVDKVKQYAIEKGTNLLERKIEIESASVSFWGGIGIQLDKIVIQDKIDSSKTPLLSAKSLDVKLQFFPLLFGDMSIDRLILREPKINLHKQLNGKNNFTFTKLEENAPENIADNLAPETKAVAAIITFENLEIQNGTVLYRDDSTATNLKLQGLQLKSSLTHPYDNQYVSSGEISVELFSLENKLNLPELNLSLKYESQFNELEKSLIVSQSNLNINGVSIKLSGNIDNLFSELNAKINVQSEQVNIKELLKFVPPDKKTIIDDFQLDGNLGFDFDIDYSSDSLLYFGTLNLQNSSVAHNSIAGKFICNDALVDVKNNNLRFNINEGEFDGKPFKGHFTINDFENPFITGAISGSINLKYLEPFLPTEDNHSLSGIAQLNLKSSGNLKDIKNMKFQGDIKADNVSYNSSFMLEPLESLELEMFFDNEIISIKKFSAQTLSGQLDLDGRITSLMQYMLADSTDRKNYNPTIDAKLNGNLELSVFNEILPQKGNPILSGNLQVDMQLSGSMNDLSLFKPHGKLLIQNGSYDDALLPEKVERFEASLNVLPDTIIVNKLHVEFETSDANFQGKLIDPFPFLLPIKNLNRKNIDKPLFLFTFISSRFDIDKLFPEAVPGIGNESKIASLDSVSTIILPDIDGRGNFIIDTLIYSQVELTSLNGKINIKDKKIECYDVSGFAYSGQVEGNTTIDLADMNSPQYVGTFNAVQIEVNEFANRFSKFQNVVSGKVDMKGSYNAVGWEPEQFLNSLTMKSTSSIRRGKIQLSEEVLSNLNKSLHKLAPNLQKEQTVQNFFTNIIVEDGNVSFDKLVTKLGDLGDLEISGFYNFDGSVSYDGKIKLSKELTKKLTSQNNLLGGLSSLLSKNSSVGQIVLPLKIGGTMDKPDIKLDLSTVLQNSAKGLLDNFIK